jgi:hypothetical protein
MKIIANSGELERIVIGNSSIGKQLLLIHEMPHGEASWI